MYSSRQSNNLINTVHERGLRLPYRKKTNKKSLSEKMDPQFIKKTCKTSWLKYKIVNGIAPPIMNSLFNFRAFMNVYCTNVLCLRCQYWTERLCAAVVVPIESTKSNVADVFLVFLMWTLIRLCYMSHDGYSDFRYQFYNI